MSHANEERQPASVTARTISAFVGAALVIAAAMAPGAGASPVAHAVHRERAVDGEGPVLKRTAVSWVYFASRGNAQRACRLQVTRSVMGVPCDQLPGFGQPLYCPAFPAGAGTNSIWRTPGERVVKVRVEGNVGSVVLRASNKRSKMSGRASFRKVGLNWRILSFESQRREFNPAGLIFTDGKDIRGALWPPHC